MKIIFLIFFSLYFISGSANAQFWGPKNYEECVLEKMKGQHQSLLPTARQACRNEFPPPLKRQKIQLNNEDWEWEQKPKDKIVINVINLPQHVKLEKAEAIFLDTCGEKLTKPAFQATAEKATFSNKFEFRVPPRQFECARVTFTGMAP